MPAIPLSAPISASITATGIARSVEFRKGDPAEVPLAATVEDVVDAFGKHKKVSCVDYPTMADLLGGYHKFVLHRWHRTKRFPRATHTVLSNGHRKAVYTAVEAKKLITIMREHQGRKLYLSERDTDTIGRLFSVMI